MSLYVNIEKNLKGFHLSSEFEMDDRCVGILGASGCGKSMTLKCIAGIIAPDRGKIILNGRTLFDSENKINLPPQERNVGYLFQNYALFPHMNVRKNIEMAMTHMTKNEREERVNELIAAYELTDLSSRYPKQLSGGQQQRVALARIMASDPEILMLDEPFSALDVYLRDQIRSQVRRVLKKYAKDTILVSHDINEVRRFCDNVIVMSDGSCVEKGDVREIFRHPKKVQTARLAGVRNISKVQETADHLHVTDWGIDLPKDHLDKSYVGVRDGDLVPVEESVDGMIPVQWSDSIESNDEYQLQFMILDKEGKETGDYLWWRISGEREKVVDKASSIKGFTIKEEHILWLY